MINKEYYDKVWKKYQVMKNPNKRDSFYNGHYYTSNKINNNNIYKMVAMFIAVIIGTAGLVYGAGALYQYILQETSNANPSFINVDSNSEGYEKLGFKLITDLHDFYYKKIINYEDYTECKRYINSLLEMTEDDFKENFLIVVISANSNTGGLHISNIESDNSTLYIEVDKSEEENAGKGMVSAKVDKNLNRDNIKLTQKKEETYSINYTPIKELPKDYTLEEAVNDNCFVIDKDGEVISNNKERITDFINNTQNGNDDFIRIVSTNGVSKETEENAIIITDIQYDNGSYKVCRDQSRCISLGNDIEYYYNTYSKIEDVKNDAFAQNCVRLTSLYDVLVVAFYK